MIDFLVKLIGKITWQKLFAKFHKGRQYLLTTEEQLKIMRVLEYNSCIILTRRNSHLSTYGTSLAHFLKTGKWGYWSHALLNIELDQQPYKLIEATGIGTHWSGFAEVFNCDSACILKPRGLSLEDWKKVFDNAEQLIGKPYDTLFNFDDSNKLSCIELVYLLLNKVEPNSECTNSLSALLRDHGVLTPQMLYDTKAFDVILEFRH